MRVKTKRRGILAGHLHKISATLHPLLGDPRQIGGGVFDAHNHRIFGQDAHCLGRHINYRAARNIIDHDWQAHRGCGLKMRDQPALCWFVIIRRHHQRGIGARLFGGLDQTHGFDGVVGPCPGHNWHTTSRLRDDGFDHQIVFFVG